MRPVLLGMAVVKCLNVFKLLVWRPNFGENNLVVDFLTLLSYIQWYAIVIQMHNYIGISRAAYFENRLRNPNQKPANTSMHTSLSHQGNTRAHTVPFTQPGPDANIYLASALSPAQRGGRLKPSCRWRRPWRRHRCC